MNIKRVVIKLLKEYARKMQNELHYTSIGHSRTNPKSKLWWWNNNEEELHVKPGMMGFHSDYNTDNKDFWGRYDDEKNIVSLAGRDYPIPPNLIQRLKFEFGDDVKFQEFIYEESLKEGQDDYFTDYTSIGHSPDKGNKLWYWKDGDLIVEPAKDNVHEYKSGEYQGRYDAKTHTISIVNMASYINGDGSTRLDNLPPDLLKRLKFEFGDNIKMKTFFEEGKLVWPPDNSEDYYTNIGHDYDEKTNPTKIWWCDKFFDNFKIKSGFGTHPDEATDGDGYWGRFDPKKNLVSVSNNNGIEAIPETLKNHLRFEFGNNIRFKSFYLEENKS